MGTLVDASSATSQNYARQVARFSTGDLLVGALDPNNDIIELYLSTDEGNTWTNEGGATAEAGTISTDSATEELNFGLAIDSQDRVHLSSRDPSDSQQILYNRFDASISSGIVTGLVQSVTDEVAFSGQDVGYSVLTIDSNDVPYIVHALFESMKGSTYFHLGFVERDGVASWTDHGAFATGQTDHVNPSIANTEPTFLEIVWQNVSSGSTQYNRWDISSNSFSIQETVTSVPFNGSVIAGPMITVDNEILRRDSGSWFLEAFTDDGVSTSTITVTEGHFSIFSASLFTSFDVSSEDGFTTAITWSQNGSKMFVSGAFSSSIYEYNVSVPFDLTSTITLSNSASVGGFPTEVEWNNVGTKLYVLDTSAEEIREYDVSEPFDLSSTITQIASFDVSGDDTSPRGMAWSADGSKLYMCGQTGFIFQYDVSVPFDLSSTITLEVIIDISGFGGTPAGIAWDPNGEKMFTASLTDGEIQQFSIGSPFDLGSGVTHVQTFVVSSEETSPTGIAWNDTGTKMYMIGDILHEYHVRGLSVIYSTDGTGAYGVDGDIRANTNNIGEFSTGEEETLESSANSLVNPSSRWQLYNNDAPEPEVIDFIYYDETAGDLYYSNIPTPLDTFSVRVDGSVVDIPIYLLTHLDDNRVRVRKRGTTGAARLVDTANSPLHITVGGTIFGLETQ